MAQETNFGAEKLTSRIVEEAEAEAGRIIVEAEAKAGAISSPKHFFSSSTTFIF